MWINRNFLVIVVFIVEEVFRIFFFYGVMNLFLDNNIIDGSMRKLFIYIKSVYILLVGIGFFWNDYYFWVCGV